MAVELLLSSRMHRHSSAKCESLATFAFYGIAGLLCLKTAKAGGESSWSSSVSVHNELLRLGRQDLVETLAGDWWIDRKVRAFLQPHTHALWWWYHDPAIFYGSGLDLAESIAQC